MSTAIALGGKGELVAGMRARLAAGLLAGILGLAMLYGVGFSPIEALHNAAHDTRHAVPFPCH